ncbi:MAG: class I SAM-dependent methyltransferase [Bacteroidota bacterium]
MKNNDRYVYSMDWGNCEMSSIILNNYREYQYNLIKNYVGNNILEVGSGDRKFTAQIAKNKPQLTRILSIEPSAVLFDLYQNNNNFAENITFQCIDLFNLDFKNTGKFDTAFFIHVLEHIEEDKKALDIVCDSIQPGGYVLIQVPALPFLFSNHDRSVGHYRRYNKKTLKSIVDQEKYTIEKLWYQDPIGIIGSLYYFKHKKIKLKSKDGIRLVKKQGQIYDKYIIPFERFLEKYIKFPFGLSLTMVLKKN